MIVEPKVREFICTTAHPTGCYENVKRQIAYVKDKGTIEGPKRVLVIGASTGYGLASRITAAFACQASTIGVMFEKPSNGKRTATPGWYNTVAFEKEAEKNGLYAKSINGDAFSLEVKEKVIEMIKEDLGQVDMVIYSLAAPRRTTADGTVWASSLKTTGEAFTEKSLDLRNNTIVTKTVEPAKDGELEGTIKVMGGEDWKLWIEQLKAADVLADQAITVAYSYIGPEITYPIYKEGSIGQAKKHLYQTADELNEEVDGLLAYVSVNKAVVTQSSAAIPIVPLYLSLLFKVMKEKGLHEDCIKQMYRLVHDRLCCKEIPTDQNRLIRVDDYEMKPEVQEAVAKLWDKVSKDNIKEIADLDGYWDEFYEIFGFGIDGVDYDADVAIQIPIPSLDE